MRGGGAGCRGIGEAGGRGGASPGAMDEPVVETCGVREGESCAESVGSRGGTAGTGTGGGGGDGSCRGRRKLCSPYCFLTALNNASALDEVSHHVNICFPGEVITHKNIHRVCQGRI